MPTPSPLGGYLRTMSVQTLIGGQKVTIPDEYHLVVEISDWNLELVAAEECFHFDFCACYQ